MANLSLRPSSSPLNSYRDKGATKPQLSHERTRSRRTRVRSSSGLPFFCRHANADRPGRYAHWSGRRSLGGIGPSSRGVVGIANLSPFGLGLVTITMAQIVGMALCRRSWASR